MALIHLDAGVVIGFLDAADVHHSLARDVIALHLDHANRLAMATSAFAECLVGPARRGPDAVEVVQDLCRRLPIELVDLTPDIALAAAHLRAQHKPLRLPDALVIATASTTGADQLWTTDRGWPIGELDVSVSISVVLS